MGYIYMLIDTRNGKRYIGKHIGNKKNYWSGGLIPNRIAKKYGKDVFNRIILEDDIPNEVINDREIFYIKKYNTIKEGYNLTFGGDGGNTISNNPNKVVIIDKIRKSLEGRVFNDNHKKKLKENHMSKDPINRKKLSDALKGKSKSKDHKIKLSKSISEYNKKIKRWAGDDNPLNNEEIKIHISKLNRERGYKRRLDNIENFIYDFTNNLIDKTNIKKYKYKLSIWKKDLGEEKINSIIPKNIMDGFIELCGEIKNNNINLRINNFIGFKHSDVSKSKISNNRKDKFLKFCYEIDNLMKGNNIEYLSDLYDKKTYLKVRKKIKSSKFLNQLSDEIKENILKLKPTPKKEKLITDNNKFYGNKNKSIVIDGIKYDSISDASKRLLIDRGVIRYRLKSEKYLTYIYM